MAFTNPPKTWVTGELVTASIGNTHWRDQFSAIYTELTDTRIEKLATYEATVGNVGVGEDDLALTALAAAKIGSNGTTVRGIYWGKTASNASAKTLRARCIEGANNTVLVSVALTVSELGHWLLAFAAMRTGATTCRATAQALVGPANSPVTKSVANVTQPTATWANAVTFKVTADATADNDVTLEGGYLYRTATPAAL